jgi:membrane-associated phospholipid phosphatase
MIKLKGIDWLTLFFCTWMLCLIAYGWNGIVEPVKHFVIYLSIIAGVLTLVWFTAFIKDFAKQENCHNGICRFARPRAYKLLVFIRNFYPVTLYLYFFESNTVTNQVFFGRWLDPFFMSIDHAIFGYYPSMEWGIRLNSIWIKEILYFSYFSYYLMILGLPVLFYIKKRQVMQEVVFVLSFVFYFCYFIYSWLPVIGGRYIPEAMVITQQMQGGIFQQIMAYIYTHSPHLGGAFPSSHIAISLVLSALAFKHFRALGIIMFSVTFFLSIATVYCHYHWFIDSVTGVLVGLLGYWIGQSIYKQLSENKNEA